MIGQNGYFCAALLVIFLSTDYTDYHGFYKACYLKLLQDIVIEAIICGNLCNLWTTYVIIYFLFK